MLACINGNLPFIEKHLEQALLGKKSLKGVTSVEYAIIYLQEKVLRILAKQKSFNPNAINTKGLNLLHLALLHHYESKELISLAQYLLQIGVNPKEKEFQNSYLPIDFAILRKQTVIEELLKSLP